MPLRCLLFSSDKSATQPLTEVLAELGIDADLCPEPAMATEKVSGQKVQILVLDWGEQPEAERLIATARTRKASERPLILAMVGDDAEVPEALRAGANSILRKPITANQARDIITTARDLLRAKVEQSAATAKAFAAKASASASVSPLSQAKTTLRAGEFLQSSPPAPGAEFVIESDSGKHLEQPQAPVEIDLLKELEPMAATLGAAEKNRAGAEESQPRGLAWYSKTRKAAVASAASPALQPVPVPAKADLLNYEQTAPVVPTSFVAASQPERVVATKFEAVAEPPADFFIPQKSRDEEAESRLHAYMAGEQKAEPTAGPDGSVSRRLPVAAIVVSIILLLSAVAYWKLPFLQRVLAPVKTAVHAWLNPQAVAPPQAPVTHETFSHAGDEYKLPVAEAIPDATTDPSQIRVVPVVDPTAKHPNGTAAKPDELPGSETQSPTDPSAAPSSPDGSTSTAPIVASPTTSQPPPVSAPAVASAPAPSVTQTEIRQSEVPQPVAPTPKRNSPAFVATSSGIPSSLKSQMATSAPEASGNKSPDSALPSIEPVVVPEAAARNLLQQQPLPVYPESAKGQSGTVILQVLIGRDGTVQDAKFFQGSLVFARSAIEAVKQWHFQPYTMNGRAVSVVTSLTVNFKPAN